jgi:iron(III) transport system substrate-binding protein
MFGSFFRQFIAIFTLISFISGCKNGSSPDTGRQDKVQEIDQVVTLYSYRFLTADQELFQQFEQATGIKVNVVTAPPKDLIDRLVTEGGDSPADLIIINDVAALQPLVQHDLLDAISGQGIDLNVPLKYRDPKGHWVGLSRSAMGFIYAIDRVQPGELKAYSDLREDRWNGKVLLTQAARSGNFSLIASMAVKEGVESARDWAAGVVKNSARPPLAGDYDQIPDIAAGRAQVGLVDAASLIQYQRSGNPDNFKAAEALGFVYPVNDEQGTYIRICAAAIRKNSPRQIFALRLIEFLTSREAQEVFAGALYEYPVNPRVLPSDFLIDLGGFREADMMPGYSEEQIQSARDILKEAGWE